MLETNDVRFTALHLFVNFSYFVLCFTTPIPKKYCIYKNQRSWWDRTLNIFRPPEEGGLGVPDIKRYQIACLCSYFWHWFKDDPDSTWLTFEAAPVTPIPLRNILYISKKRISLNVKRNFILQNSLKIWRLTRKLENQRVSFFSSLLSTQTLISPLVWRTTPSPYGPLGVLRL